MKNPGRQRLKSRKKAAKPNGTKGKNSPGKKGGGKDAKRKGKGCPTHVP